MLHGFDTTSVNCYCSMALNTGRVKIPCAAEQEGCCTELKVEKSYKPNTSRGISDISHVVSTSTNRAL